MVYFEGGVPELFDGDLSNDKAVMRWMRAELKQEEIKEVTVPMLDKLIERGRIMAVMFYSPAKEEDLKVEGHWFTFDVLYYSAFVRLRKRNKAKFNSLQMDLIFKTYSRF